MVDEPNQDRIADNPSIKSLTENLPLLNLVRGVAGFLSVLGVADGNLAKMGKLAEDALSKKGIVELPDRFNEAFAGQGWIATGSLSVDTMEKALRLHESGDSIGAEEELLDWFNKDRINMFAIHRAKRFNQAHLRWDQTREALALTFEQRYWSAVPLILIACDGFASDVLPTSPFSEAADLQIFDSIVGHPTALPILIRHLTKRVLKSSNDELTLPLRHGILHGRSLGYANRVVCMKSWLLKIALVDWAWDKAGEQERIRAHASNARVSLLDLADKLAKSADDRRQMQAFGPIERHGPFTGTLDKASPEHAIIGFLRCWQERNYGGMANRAWDPAGLSLNKLAGQLRRDAELTDLTHFHVHSVRQAAVARAEAAVRLKGRAPRGLVEETFEIVAFRYKDNGDVAMPNENGKWLVRDNCIFEFMRGHSSNKKPEA